MPPVNPPTPTSSTNIFQVSRDSSNPEDQDIWFDAIDHVEMEETWFEGAEAFDAHEEHQAAPSSSDGEAADLLVPFTEDCRRGVQQFVRVLGEYGESRMLSACLSKILPGTPVSLVIAANSLYAAVTERRNIDTAALHALGLASGFLPENINAVSWLATFIRDTVTGWTDETFLQQFLGNEDNHTSTHLFTALAVTAIVAGRWMKDEGAPQRGVLKVPAFMANILIRASHYWTALGNMAGSLPSGAEIPENTGPSQRAPAFEVDTRMEMTGDVFDATASGTSAPPRLTAFSSNSTARPEAYTRATVLNRLAPAAGENPRLSVPEQAHFLAVDKLRQESGLSDLLYCATSKTESRQQTNEKVITNSYFNTKCDVTVYPEPLTKGADSIPVHTDIPETQVSSAATSRGGDNTLLPLVMTGAVVAPVATSYMQALKSKPVIAAGVTAALTGAGSGGKWLWDKFSTHNPEGSAYDIENNALKAKKENIKIINTLVNEGVLKKGKFNKERLLSAVAEYLFGNEMGIAGSTKKVRKLARKILSTEGLYGGRNSEQLSKTQAESVVRAWVFKNILGMLPDEYILNNMINDPHPEYYTISSIHHLLSMEELLKNNTLHYKRIPPSQWGYLNAMWYYFRNEEMPFLDFSFEWVKELALRDFNFANLYSGSLFQKEISFKNLTPEEAINIGEKIWGLAIHDGVEIDKLAYYDTPSQFFMGTEHQSGNINNINNYIQYTKKVGVVKKDINEKHNKYLMAAKAWLSKGKLADYIIYQCPVLSPGLPDQADAIRTPEQKREKAVKSAKQLYLNGIDKPCENAPESLSDEYHNLTANVADSFREIDKYLILSAISTLPDDEMNFIQSPDGIIYTATAYIQMMQPGSLFITNKHFIERTDLFTVKRGGSERIYALKAETNNSGYKIIRVDRDIKQYILSGILGKIFDDYKITWDNIEDSHDINSFGVEINEPALTGNDNNIETIKDALSRKHREHLYHALHEAGNDQSDIQKLWNVIKHLIPFYDCVEGFVNNNLEQAIPSCLMDAVSFIPVFGKAASLSGKFGMGLARGLRNGVVIVRMEGIGSAGKALLREVSLPKTTELASLGKASLRAIYPGVEMLSGINRMFANKILKLLSSDEKMAGLAKNIISSGTLDKLPLRSTDKIVMGILPEIQLPVPVKAIERKAGRNIYVQMNPETRALFGRKYVKDGSGNLVPYTTRNQKVKTHDNKVTDIVEWSSFQSKKLNEYNVERHDSGLYSTLDFHGEKTGELFLIHENNLFPVTEIFQKKYYMIQGKDRRIIFEKDPNSDKFDTIDNEIIDSYMDSSWCSSHAVGRKLLMNPEVTCITIPALDYDDVTYRINIQLQDVDDVHDFDVRYRGLYGMDTSTRLDIKNKIDDTLFYENGRVDLKQESIDASAYEMFFSDKDITISNNELVFSDSSDADIISPILTKNEKLAVRRWTAIEDDIDEIFSDGMKDTTKIGMNPINYELNQKLANTEVLNEDERNMVRLLDSALNKIPPQKGEFIRISEYDKFITPWDNEIKPGDIVTNSPCYMSVSADTKYIEKSDVKDDVKANVYFRIENTYSAKPLLKGVASLVDDELESIFKRNSAFKVKQIAIAVEKTGETNSLAIKKRIVVLLEEVDIPQSNMVKNIHTGKSVNIDV